MTECIPESYTEGNAYLLGEALKLAAGGLAVFPAHINAAGRKVPSIPRTDPGGHGHGHNSASTDPTVVRHMFAIAPYATLIAVATGAASGLAVIDIDPRNGGDIWEADHLAELQGTRVHWTGGGGRHYLFTQHPGLVCANGKIAPGVDLKADDGWLAWWPAKGCTVTDRPITDMPIVLLLAALAASGPARHTDTGTSTSGRPTPPPSVAWVVALLDAMGNGPDVGRDVYEKAALAAQGCIRSLEGVDDGDDIRLAFIRWAEKYNGPDDEAEKWESDWSHRYRDTSGCRQLLRIARDDLGLDTAAWAAELDPPAAEQFAGVLALEGDVLPNDVLLWAATVSKFMPNIREFLGTLRGVSQGRLGYDEMLAKPMVLWPKGWQPLTQSDLTVIQAHCQESSPRLSKDVTRQGVIQICHENPYHRVRDYLSGLIWDGMPRLDSWLASHLGTPWTEYEAHVGRKFLLSMVARVMRPGCQADYMLILEGPQGAGKTQACRILAGDWFGDNLPDLSNKDSSQYLRGKWLIEIGELSTMNRADSNALKTYLTRTTEQYRPPFEPLEITEPRQCVFVGTTNDDEYLRDATGGRRFWPVNVGKINLRMLALERDQLFAESMVAFNAGETWWPEAGFEAEHIKPHQTSRREVDEWLHPIALALVGKVKTTINDIALVVFRLPLKDIDIGKVRRIGAILKSLDWTRRHTRTGKIWERGEDNPDDPDVVAEAAAIARARAAIIV